MPNPELILSDSSSCRSSGRWEIVLGTIHRMIFWLVMGLVALVVTIILWVISIPTRAWKIY